MLQTIINKAIKEGITWMKKKIKLLLYLILISLVLFFTISGCIFEEAPKEEQIEPESPIKEDPNLIGELTDKLTPGKTQTPPETSDGSEKENRELTLENIVQMYGDTIFRFGNNQQKTIALTFDDGPDHQFTPQILDALKKYNVKATFFISGIRAVNNIDMLKRINQEGHEIAHHGYNHLKMSNLTNEEIRGELTRLNQLFKEHLGKMSYLFRPPYGALDPELVETVKADGFHIILWDIDSLDWRGLPKEQVLNNITPNLHPGAIILQHSAGGPGQDLTGTVQALPVLIETLQKQGYQFVTISQMFAQKLGEGKKPVTGSN